MLTASAIKLELYLGIVKVQYMILHMLLKLLLLLLLPVVVLCAQWRMNLVEFLFPFRNLHARSTVYNGLWGALPKKNAIYTS